MVIICGHIINVTILHLVSSGCDATGFIGSVGAFAEIWSLTAVGYDRFLAVNYPLQFWKRINKSQVLFFIMFYDKNILN